MIIDIHAHVCAAPELYQWKAVQMSARGAHGFAPKKFADEWVRDHPDTKRNLRVMDTVGTDVQFLSPRPFRPPVAKVHWPLVRPRTKREIASDIAFREAAQSVMPQRRQRLRATASQAPKRVAAAGDKGIEIELDF
jgi:hypothetical protein